MTEYIQVITTTDSREEADRIAEALVDGRLAGCVQVVGPIRSRYRWKGAVEEAEEWLCIAKTKRDLYPEVEAAVHRVHSYEVPEILGVPVVEGSKSYLDWLEAELKK